jgi:hypothetical protein
MPMPALVSLMPMPRYEANGTLTLRPPTNRPRDIPTHNIRPPNILSTVTIFYCDTSTLRHFYEIKPAGQRVSSPVRPSDTSPTTGQIRPICRHLRRSKSQKDRGAFACIFVSSVLLHCNERKIKNHYHLSPHESLY